jgi:hypothetical protein
MDILSQRLDLTKLTNIELAYLLHRQDQRRDLGAFADVAAITKEIARRVEEEGRR